MSFEVFNETKKAIPDAPLVFIAQEILGKNCDLNLIIVSPTKIKELNLMHRGKDETTDILSFPLSENSGEIYICLEETEKKAVEFDRTYENFFKYLFIHGCTHLKGYDHSDTMEALEKKVRQKFGI